MSEQLGLEFNDRWRDEQISKAWRYALRAVAEELGLKLVASNFDKGASELGRMLDEKKRHYLKPSEIVAIMRRDHTGRALKTLAHELGYEVTKRRELSSAEKLERLNEVLDQNPELARLVREKAFGPGGR